MATMARPTLVTAVVLLGVVLSMTPAAASTVLTSDTYQAGAGCTVNFDSTATTLFTTYGPLSAFTSYRSVCGMDAVTMTYGTTYDAAATVTYGSVGPTSDTYKFNPLDPVWGVDVGKVNIGNAAKSYDVVQWVRFYAKSGKTFTTSSNRCFSLDEPLDAAFNAPADDQALLALGGCTFTDVDGNTYISGLTFFWGVRWSSIGLYGDDAGKGIALPFDFPFFCTKYKKGFKVFVDTNGYITFSKDDSGLWDNYHLYYYLTEAKSGNVAPYWLDLYIPQGAENEGIFINTLKDGPGGKPSAFLVWWRNVQTSPKLSGTVSKNLNFQAWMLPDGTVLLGYEGMSADGQYLPATAANIPSWDDWYAGALTVWFADYGRPIISSDDLFTPTKCFVTMPTTSKRLGPKCPISDYTGFQVPVPCGVVYKYLLENPIKPAYKYLGCYKDKRSSRAFPNRAWMNTLTVDKCAKFALNPPATYKDQTVKPTQPAKYFGVQFGRECWLDNNALSSIKRYGALPEAKCNMPCGGNNATKCGGIYAFKLYELVRPW